MPFFDISLPNFSLSALAFSLSHLLQNKKGPFCIVLPEENTAFELWENFKTLQSSLSDFCKTPALWFPAWNPSLFSTAATSILVREARLKTLLSLQQSSSVLVFGAFPAFSQKLASYSFLKNVSFSLHQGQEYDLTEIQSRLFSLGYESRSFVEEKGTFAFRSDRLDLWTPFHQTPFRFEFWGPALEGLFPFDPKTQRKTEFQSVASLWVPPAKELPLSQKEFVSLKKHLKTYSDKQGISRKFRDPIFTLLDRQLFLDTMEAWVPFLFSEKDHFFFTLPSPATWVLIKKDQIEKKFISFLENEKTNHALFKAQNRLLPSPERVFFSLKTFSSYIQENTVYQTYQFLSKTLPPPPHVPTLKPLSFLKPHTIQKTLSAHLEQNGKIYFFSPQKTLQTRFRHLLPFSSEIIKSSVQIFSHALDGGFSSRAPLHPALFLSDHEVFGFQKKKRPHFFQTKQKNFHTLDTLSEIQEGHLVVHFQHGIGRYEGLKRLRLLGSEMDFLVLSYAGTDRLYLPVFRLQEIQKYIGSQKVTLDKLGSNRFQKRKQNARKAAKKLAFDLLSLYAKRHASSPKPLPQRDELYESFEAKFPYQETPDQLKSLREIFSDLDKPKLMDRLLCGDVGFGKTEIAMRVAFHFVQNGYQVAALVPTTLLCLQHSRTFKERFAPEGIRVASLSRLTSTKKRKEIIQDVQTHQIDILIGTHALLNKKIKFAKLGFLIIDEEHRFGVEQKEKIQNLKTQTHVLTMTATPIPRTLALTLSSIRSISLIQTPPEDRFPVQTFVVPFQKGWIQKAIEQELKRGGQLFFVHPHVKTLPKWEVWFQKNFPDLKIGTVHGQLPKATLQKTMLDFYHQRINLLLCTSIIESGLDVPTANTMIIDRADLFGLAQLYQLRGRIGRSYQKAFCYLMIHPGAKLTAPAQKRLETLQRFFELGSGFAIAAQDLEIRGGGDLLGAEQSGHIQSVGFDLFRKMVQEAIADMKQDSTQKQDLEPTTPSTEIHSSAAAYLPKHYIAHSQEKLRFYRILSKVQTISAIDDLEAELQDRFGALPSEAKNLLWITRIKTLLLSFELKTLWLQKNHVQLEKPPHSEKSAHLFQHLLQNPSVKILTPIKIQIPFSQIDTKKNPSFTFLEKIYLFFQKQLTQNSALL